MTVTDNGLFVLKMCGVLGCALMAGVFFAFSAFVMNALARLPPPQGMAAMQSINTAVLNPLFLTPFLGTAAACLFLAIASLSRWNTPGAAYLVAGSFLYLVGTILVTLVFNVPLNEALAKAEPGSVEGERLWGVYLVQWTLWNHVRTGAALAATITLLLGMSPPAR